jgi:membrane-bound metal-dependent hydrolase YbcI (DUF457 family)
MLLFGHIGITLGTVAVLSQACSSFLRTENPAGGHNPGASQDGDPPPQASTAARFPVDYRLVILGSLLPDLIDKPIGMLILRDVFSSGRIFGHSFVVLLVFTLVGAYLWRRYGKTEGLVLSVAWALHLVFDRMWAFPATLFWPLLGWDFHQYNATGWLSRVLHSWLTYSAIILQEGLGAAIIAGLAIRLVVGKRVCSFIRTGAIEG